MKGVILTAGKATRLRPITLAMGKVLVPIYNKPMIFYELSLMINCNITDIAIVCNEDDFETYKKITKRFSDFGLNITLIIQKEAKGTANALKYAKTFIGTDDFVLLFGDNIFVMDNIQKELLTAIKNNNGITVFAKEVKNPQQFGVLKLDKNKIIDIEEKPQNPPSNLVAVGLYVYKNDAIKKLDDVQLSKRGEYELTDVILSYIKENRATVHTFNKTCKWYDTGTFDALLECSNVVKQFETEHGLFGCVELELYKHNLITKDQLNVLCNEYGKDYKLAIENSLKNNL